MIRKEEALAILAGLDTDKVAECCLEKGKQMVYGAAQHLDVELNLNTGSLYYTTRRIGETSPYNHRMLIERFSPSALKLEPEDLGLCRELQGTYGVDEVEEMDVDEQTLRLRQLGYDFWQLKVEFVSGHLAVVFSECMEKWKMKLEAIYREEEGKE